MKIINGDPINKYFDEIAELSTTKSLIQWKYSATMEGAWYFIIIECSDYLLAVNFINNSLTVYAIWDIQNKQGYTIKPVEISNLFNNIELLMPSNLFNPLTFNLESSEKSISSKSMTILLTLLSSGEYKHLSNEQLAVKAIQLALHVNSSLDLLDSAIKKKFS